MIGMDVGIVLWYTFVIGLFSVLSGALHYFFVGGPTTFNTVLVLCGGLAMALVVIIINAPWLGGPRS